jgi:hypothetical protein
MKRRIAGAALFGLGLLSLIVAAALAWVVVPAQKQVPYDLQPPDVVVEASNATFAQARTLPDGEVEVTVERGGLRNQTGIKPDYQAAADLTGELAEKTLIWNVYQATDRVDDGSPVNRAESRIALDRVSGAAVPWSGQCHNDMKEVKTENVGCVPGNVNFAGQLYLFPFGTEKKTYQYWDSGLGAALPMTFAAEEEYNGLPAYRFQQDVPSQTMPMDAELVEGLIGFLAPGAHSGSVSYRASRTLWVEPQTGAIIGYQEQQHRELVPDVGAPVVLFDASFGYDEKTNAAVLAEAEHGRYLLTMLGVYVPLGLAALGLVLVVLGIVVARRRPRDEEHRPAHAAEPEPTAVPHS